MPLFDWLFRLLHPQDVVMGIKIKSAEEIKSLRESGRLVAQTFALIKQAIRPGVRLAELDHIATEFLARKGAKPLYKGYRGRPPTHPPFPGVICASINEEICHGLPNERVLQNGDIVGIDIGLLFNGWCGDACVTYPVGKISSEAQRLLRVTEECLKLGIEAAQPGRHLSDIGAAIEAHATRYRHSVVREWGGHGLGRTLHEAPNVLHVGPAGQGPILLPGMVFTIEPMINVGRGEWQLLDDGWTVISKDRRLSAQFEHTIAITKEGPVVLSAL